MASVPDTTTFSLQDVVNVINAQNPLSANTLQDCFANADIGGFDLDYYVDGNDLLEFRNYNGTNVVIRDASGQTDITELNIAQIGTPIQTARIYVPYPDDWSIDSVSQTWIHASKRTGTGPTYLDVYCDSNATGDLDVERQGVITIINDDTSDTDTLTIIQAGD